MKVLIIDDNYTLAQTYKQLLGALNFEVQTCTCTQDAPSDLNDFKFIFIDKVLSGTNAYEVKQSLQSRAHHDVKFVLISGDIDPLTALRAEGLGFSKVMEKPISLQQFKNFFQQFAFE